MEMKWYSCAAVWVAAIFLLVNALMLSKPFLLFDSSKYPYHGWSWWVFNDLRHNQEHYNICLIGSSLVVKPNSEVEANYLGKAINLTSYHNAAYLDNLLSTRFGGSFRTYNLSAPGLMVSDAYLALKTFFSSGQRSDIVLYAIAPRDFIDSSVKNIADTDSFKYLQRQVSADELGEFMTDSPIEKLEWWLQQNCYLYHKALDLQMALADTTQPWLDKFLPSPAIKPGLMLADKERLLPKFKSATTYPERSEVKPSERALVEKQFYDNRGEYLERYQWPNLYSTELKCLQKVIALCQKRHVQLVLVNMPLLPENLSLLPAGFYDRFRQDTMKLAEASSVPFIDMSRAPAFQHKDYYDPVHLNGFGGERLFHLLVSHLADSSASEYVRQSGLAQLARYHDIAAKALYADFQFLRERRQFH